MNQGIGMQFVAMLLHQLIYRFKNEIGLTGTAANAGKRLFCECMKSSTMDTFANYALASA